MILCFHEMRRSMFLHCTVKSPSQFWRKVFYSRVNSIHFCKIGLEKKRRLLTKKTDGIWLTRRLRPIAVVDVNWCVCCQQLFGYGQVLSLVTDNVRFCNLMGNINSAVLKVMLLMCYYSVGCEMLTNDNKSNGLIMAFISTMRSEKKNFNILSNSAKCCNLRLLIQAEGRALVSCWLIRKFSSS